MLDETARISLHRDRRGARESALRAGGVLLFVGMLWQLTGLAAGAYFVLGLSVMLSLFSTMDLPTMILRHVILGQVLAGIAAMACQMLIWPYAPSVLAQILMLIPFIMLGVLVSAHRKTFIAAMDYHLVFLLLMMPHMPFEAHFGTLLATVIAVIAAPVLALLCYKAIFPVHLRRRIAHIEGMFHHDLGAIAGGSKASGRFLQWQSRFAHRSLRLLRLHEKLGLPIGEGLAQIKVYSKLGRAAFEAHELLNRHDLSAAQRRLARQVLARIAQNPAPEVAGVALGRLAPYAQGSLRGLLEVGRS